MLASQWVAAIHWLQLPVEVSARIRTRDTPIVAGHELARRGSKSRPCEVEWQLSGDSRNYRTDSISA